MNRAPCWATCTPTFYRPFNGCNDIIFGYAFIPPDRLQRSSCCLDQRRNMGICFPTFLITLIFRQPARKRKRPRTRVGRLGHHQNLFRQRRRGGIGGRPCGWNDGDRPKRPSGKCAVVERIAASLSHGAFPTATLWCRLGRERVFKHVFLVEDI
jgi:hypothetical protein